MNIFGKFAAPDRSYDRAAVLDDAGREVRSLSPEEFSALGLDERVRLILGKKLRFYKGSTEVPLKQALND